MCALEGPPAQPPPPPPRFAVIDNPLLVAWGQVARAWSAGRLTSEQLRELRRRCVEQWAWAVPDDAALHLLSGLGPIVEMGAGTGYWARLLRRRGVDVVAYDRTPGVGCSWNRDGAAGPVLHTRVLRGEPDELRAHPDRTLLLVWPPFISHEDLDAPDFVSFGRRCLREFRGTTVVYIGEPRRVRPAGGRPSWTADDTFLDELLADFEVVQWTAIPRWPGLFDALWVLRRRAGGAPGDRDAVGPPSAAV